MSGPHTAQEALWDAIHNSEPLSSSVPASQLPAGRAAAHFVGDARLDAVGRIHIYAEMYEVRLLEAMQQDFPWTAQLLGETAFATAVRAYVKAHPLRSFTLAGMGENFPAFLQQLGGRTDVPELAQLERMRSEVSVAADVDTLPVAALGAHGEAIVGMRCVFAPSMRHAPMHYDVSALVDALVGAGDAPREPKPLQEPDEMVAWRLGEQVFHTALSAEAALALRMASAGQDIAAICDVFASCPQPAQSAFAALGAWFSDGWVQRLEGP